MLQYEWCIEYLDENGDIYDNHFEEKLAALSIPEERHELVLIRGEGGEDTGIEYQCWAYVKDGILPEYFADSLGGPLNIKVPKRFFAEFEKYKNKK